MSDELQRVSENMLKGTFTTHNINNGIDLTNSDQIKAQDTSSAGRFNFRAISWSLKMTPWLWNTSRYCRKCIVCHLWLGQTTTTKAYLFKGVDSLILKLLLQRVLVHSNLKSNQPARVDATDQLVKQLNLITLIVIIIQRD